VTRRKVTMLKRPRIPMPDWVRLAILGRKLMADFSGRPPYQQNDYLGWILRAKLEATREKRLEQMLDELASGDAYMGMPYRSRSPACTSGQTDMPTGSPTRKRAATTGRKSAPPPGKSEPGSTGMKTYRFETEIHQHPGLDAAYVEFPFDVEKEFGVKGQVKVRALFDGAEYRGSLVRMGHQRHCIGITQAMRLKIRKNPGDQVEVVITRDDDPREVELPHDVRELLEANPAAKKAYETMSFTRRKELVTWVVGAKRVETREKRLNSLIDRILGSPGK